MIYSTIPHRQNVLFDSIIECDPEKLSGTPVFPGTRVPIQTLFDCLEEGENLEDFLDQFPTVTRPQVVRVLEASSMKLPIH